MARPLKVGRRLRALLVDIGPLRESPPFRRLWAGTALSSVGGMMTAFALTLQVYRLTHSSLAVGALALTQGAPALVLGPLGGSLADGRDRRRLVLVTGAGLAAVSAGLAAQAFLGSGLLWLIYLLAAVQAALEAVDGPARRTFLPRLLPPERIAAGAALRQLSFHASVLIGPALAGLVTAVFGLRICYVVDAASFGAALYATARLPAMPPEGGTARPGLRAAAQGLRFIARQPVLAGALLADLDATVLGMPVALFPALNAAHFGGRPQTLGLLTSALAAGGLIGSALSGPVGWASRPGRVMLAAVAVWGAALAGFGLTQVFWLALVLLAAAGAADTTSVVCRSAIVQVITPDRLRGRVASVDYVVGVSAPQLGGFRAGLVAALTTPAASAVGGGLLVMLGAAALRLAVPDLARYRLPTSAPPEADAGRRPGLLAAEEP